jgi:hypothetical protein
MKTVSEVPEVSEVSEVRAKTKHLETDKDGLARIRTAPSAEWKTLRAFLFPALKRRANFIRCCATDFGSNADSIVPTVGSVTRRVRTHTLSPKIHRLSPLKHEFCFGSWRAIHPCSFAQKSMLEGDRFYEASAGFR